MKQRTFKFRTRKRTSEFRTRKRTFESETRQRLPGLVFLTFILLFSALPVAAQVRDGWSSPVNLSRSGAATAPQLIPISGGARVFWWDQFDGITMTEYDGMDWTAPRPIPIEIIGERNNQVFVEEVTQMPDIVGDRRGWAHALWLSEPDPETDLQALLHSYLSLGAENWSPPTAVSTSALAWQLASGTEETLHLVYIRPAHTPAFPAGLYYRRSTDGGRNWSAPTLLHENIYVRLLEETDVHLDVAAGTTAVQVVWEDGQQEQSFQILSMDNGVSWGEPMEINGRSVFPTHPQVAVSPAEDLLRFWETYEELSACALYQQYTTDEGATWSPPKRILQDLGYCPEQLRVISGGTDDLFLLAEGGEQPPMIARQDTKTPAKWGAPTLLSFSFPVEDNSRLVVLSDLNVALSDDGKIFIIGQEIAGQEAGNYSEIWFLEHEIATWSWEPSTSDVLWSPLTVVTREPVAPSLPTTTYDTSGRLHVFWKSFDAPNVQQTSLRYSRAEQEVSADGEVSLELSPPTTILSWEGDASSNPTVTAADDTLHIVWGGERILYSQAETRFAYTRNAWRPPVSLPRPGTNVAVGSPVIAAQDNAIHVVYPVPFNENRGLYYTYSNDGGISWSDAVLIVDAVEEGWHSVDQPALAVDSDGELHVTWRRSTWRAGAWIGEGIYYARSFDDRTTWATPTLITHGVSHTPSIAVMPPRRVHLVWHTPPGAIEHRWSADGGRNWLRSARVPGFQGVSGSAILLSDGAQYLYLLGSGESSVGERVLYSVTWYDTRWTSLHTEPLGLFNDPLPGIFAALQPHHGHMVVTLRADTQLEDSVSVFALGRTITATHAIAAAPEREADINPDHGPDVTPADSPSSTPTPIIDTSPPTASSAMLTLGPIALPRSLFYGLTAIILLLALIWITPQLIRH